MATTVTSTINKSGNDYSTITAWEAAKQGDLVSADQVQVAECYDDNGALGGFTISGSTTDSTRFMKATVPSGERHNGKYQDGGCLVQSTSDFSSLIVISDNYFIFEYFRVNFDNTGNATAISVSGGNCHIRFNVIRIKETSTRAKVGISTGTTTGSFVYRNFLFCAGVASGSATGLYYGGFIVENSKFYNNTVVGFTTGISGDSNSAVTAIKNNLHLNNGTDFVFKASTTHSNNASSDTTGDSGLTSKTTSNEITSTTSGSEDLHLKSGASVIDAGTNLGSPYDTDIDNVSVSGTWDIGADEYVASGVTVTPSTLTLTLTLETSTRIATQLPSAQALTAALQSPTPEGRVLPSAQALTSSLQTPVPMVTFLPSALGLVSTLQTPTCLVTIFPSEQGLTLTLQSPSVDTGSGNVTFMASTLAMTLDLLAPTLQVTVSPSALALVASLQAAGFEVKMNPATLTISASLNSITPAITLTPSEFQLAASVLAVSPKVNLTPSEIALTLALLNPSINPGIGEALQQIISSDERLRQVLSSVERLRLENDNLQG